MEQKQYISLDEYMNIYNYIEPVCTMVSQSTDYEVAMTSIEVYIDRELVDCGLYDIHTFIKYLGLATTEATFLHARLNYDKYKSRRVFSSISYDEHTTHFIIMLHTWVEGVEHEGRVRFHKYHVTKSDTKILDRPKPFLDKPHLRIKHGELCTIWNLKNTNNIFCHFGHSEDYVSRYSFESKRYTWETELSPPKYYNHETTFGCIVVDPYWEEFTHVFNSRSRCIESNGCRIIHSKNKYIFSAEASAVTEWGMFPDIFTISQ